MGEFLRKNRTSARRIKRPSRSLIAHYSNPRPRCDFFEMRSILIAIALATSVLGQSYPQRSSQDAAILKDIRYLSGDGTFGAAYSQDDGVEFKEETDASGDRKGSYSYVDPNGHRRTVFYTAGKNGFQAIGDHIPTSRPLLAPKLEYEPLPEFNPPEYQVPYQPEPPYRPPTTTPRPQYRPARPQYRPEPQTQYRSEPQPQYRSEPLPQYRSEPQPQYRSTPQPQYRPTQPPYRPALQPEYNSELQSPFRPDPQLQYRPEPQIQYRSEPLAQYHTELQTQYRPEPQPEYRAQTPRPRSRGSQARHEYRTTPRSIYQSESDENPEFHYQSQPQYQTQRPTRPRPQYNEISTRPPRRNNQRGKLDFNRTPDGFSYVYRNT